MQTDIKQTVETIQEILFYAKEKIESIKVNEKFISDPETFLEEMKSEANQIQIAFMKILINNQHSIYTIFIFYIREIKLSVF